MNTSMTVALNSLPNLASASPWCEVTIEKAKKFNELSTVTDLSGYIDNFIATPSKSKTVEDKIADTLETPFKWVSVSMASYYNDLWYGLDKKKVPAMTCEIAAGDQMLIAPVDLVNLITAQKNVQNCSVLVNAVANPVIIKHNQTLQVQVRNYTANP